MKFDDLTVEQAGGTDLAPALSTAAAAADIIHCRMFDL